MTPEITLKVATRLRYTILRNYYRDVRTLKRKLTFRGVEDRIKSLEIKLYDSFTKLDAKDTLELKYVINELKAIKAIIVKVV